MGEMMKGTGEAFGIRTKAEIWGDTGDRSEITEERMVRALAFRGSRSSYKARLTRFSDGSAVVEIGGAWDYMSSDGTAFCGLVVIQEGLATEHEEAGAEK